MPEIMQEKEERPHLDTVSSRLTHLGGIVLIAGLIATVLTRFDAQPSGQAVA